MERKEELIQKANAMLDQAYAPYSNFHVGAALLTESGQIYGGCNIENASYPAGICAERTALVKAVSEGHHRFKALAVSSRADQAITPCGICRQMLAEFCPPHLPVVLTHQKATDEIETTLGDLLPGAFTKEDL